MNELPRQRLVELVGRYGFEVARDPRRCEALLRDVCPQHKREIFVLVSAQGFAPAQFKLGKFYLNGAGAP